MCLCEVSILINSDHDRRIVFLCQFYVVAGKSIFKFWKSSKAIIRKILNEVVWHWQVPQPSTLAGNGGSPLTIARWLG